MKMLQTNLKIEKDHKEKELFNPPQFEGMPNSSHILKKSKQSISIGKFKRMIALIKWSVEFRGCDHYALINNKGQMTNFELHGKRGGEEIEVRLWNDDYLFGSDRCGFISGNLSEAEIIVSGGDSLFVSFGGTKRKTGLTLFLNNRDKTPSHAEQFVRREAKDYIARMLCKNVIGHKDNGDEIFCNKVMTESRPMSALYIYIHSFQIGMTSPFNSPRCPKCNYKTYSDINFAVGVRYYNLKTKRYIKFEKIKKMTAAKYRTYCKLIDRQKARDEK